jgi:hypothetical protein
MIFWCGDERAGAAMSGQGQIRVGIGGWVFPPWRGKIIAALTQGYD